MSSLFSIPPELLLEALDFFDYKSLLVCRLLCRRFRDIIDSTPTCQYKFDLVTFGVEGGISQVKGRSEALKKYQAGWDELEWSSELTIPKQEGNSWELYGGVLGQQTSTKFYTFTRLPAIARGIPEKTWTVGRPGFEVRDFGMDPSQDLLVLIQKATWNASIGTTHYVHLLSLEKAPGNPHPLAKGGEILTTMQPYRATDISYTIQISGDFVGLLITLPTVGENEFLVWDWKSGDIKLHLTGDEIQSFSFLSDRHVVLCVLCHADIDDEETIVTLEPTLVVVDFLQPSEKPQNVLDIEAGIYFRYPLLDDDAGLVSFQIRSDPAPGWQPGSDSNVPFHLSRDNRVYVVTLRLQIQLNSRFLMLFVPSSTLMSKVNKIEQEGIANLNHVMAWEEWGPAGTRMMVTHHPYSSVWVCFVFGTRYIAMESPNAGDKNLWARVYDFNDRPVRRGLVEVEGDNIRQGRERIDRRTSTETVYELGPLPIPRGGIFKEDVETWLPFRWRSVELDVPASTPLGGCAIMCSEDNIIIVLGSAQKYRILNF